MRSLHGMIAVALAALALLCGPQPAHAASRTTPKAPKHLARVENLAATVQGQGVLLTWKAAAGSDGYRVYHAEGKTVPAGAFWLTSNGPETAYLFTEVKPGGLYSFRVAALRSSKVGPLSRLVTVQIPVAGSRGRSDAAK